MTSKMFHKLDAFFSFRPKFYVAITAGRYEKVGP